MLMDPKKMMSGLSETAQRLIETTAEIPRQAAETVAEQAVKRIGKPADDPDQGKALPVLEAAEKNMIDCWYRHDRPLVENLPTDLHDVQGKGIATKSGHAVAGHVTATDLLIGWPSLGSQIWAALFVLAFGLVMATLSFFTYMLQPLVSVESMQWLFWPVAVVLGVTTVVFARGFSSVVAELLAWIYSGMSLCLLSEPISSGNPFGIFVVALTMTVILFMWVALGPLFMRFNRARSLARNVSSTPSQTPHGQAGQVQAFMATKDKSKFIRFGVATGVLWNVYGDPAAPDQGQTMGMTENDLKTGLIALGKTGEGKSEFLKRLISQYITNPENGLVVMDGKGELPREIGESEDIELIDLAVMQIALIEGLDPEKVAYIVFAFAGDHGSDQQTGLTWINWAIQHVKNAARLVYGAHQRNPKKVGWSLWNVALACRHHEYRTELCKTIRDGELGNPVTKMELRAADYFAKIYNAKHPEFRSSVDGTVETYLAKLVDGHPDIIRSAEAFEGVDITQALHGGKFGLAISEARYGDVAKSVLAFIKCRLYQSLLAGDVEKCRLMILQDEYPDIALDMDAPAMAKLRSTGGIGVIAAQNIEQVWDHMGHDAGDGLLDNFKSVVAFRCSDATLTWLQRQAGKTRQLVSTFTAKTPDLDGQMRQALSQAMTDKTHPDHKRLQPLFSRRLPLLGLALDKIKGLVTTEDEHEVSNAYFEVLDDEPVLPDCVRQYLNEAGTAVCLLQRAGSPRRDVVRMDTPWRETYEEFKAKTN